MTKQVDDTVIIEAENKQQYDLCGKIAELRPYGPNGECVCIDCGMQNREAAIQRIKKRFLDSSVKKIIKGGVLYKRVAGEVE